MTFNSESWLSICLIFFSNVSEAQYKRVDNLLILRMLRNEFQSLVCVYITHLSH